MNSVSHSLPDASNGIKTSIMMEITSLLHGVVSTQVCDGRQHPNFIFSDLCSCLVRSHGRENVPTYTLHPILEGTQSCIHMQQTHGNTSR